MQTRHLEPPLEDPLNGFAPVAFPLVRGEDIDADVCVAMMSVVRRSAGQGDDANGLRRRFGIGQGSDAEDGRYESLLGQILPPALCALLVLRFGEADVRVGKALNVGGDAVQKGLLFGAVFDGAIDEALRAEYVCCHCARVKKFLASSPCLALPCRALPGMSRVCASLNVGDFSNAS